VKFGIFLKSGLNGVCPVSTWNQKLLRSLTPIGEILRASLSELLWGNIETCRWCDYLSLLINADQLLIAGIVLVTALGVALGVFVGCSLLGLASLCQRRYR